MKRKFLSTLLFGALACATLGTVTSCKDYDDDINSLQTEQASLSSKIEALQKSADAATTSIAAAQSTANDALSKATANSTEISNLKSLIDEVKTSAANAGAKAAAAAEDAAAAKTTADDALAKAQEALNKLGEADIAGLVARVAALEEKTAGLDALTSGLNELKEQVAKAATKEDLEKAQAKLNSYDNWFNSVFTMVTDVKLFGTFSGVGFTKASDLAEGGDATNLEMMHGNVAYTADFGDNEALKNDLKTVFATATPVQKFTKGDDIKTSTGLLLSINPVNADLTNSKVLIVNSKGEAMDDYVEVVASEATRYNELITRGSSINTGLWKVPVQFKDGVDMKKFAEAITTTDKEGKSHSVLYAVAVNNTDTVKTYGGENRFVASTFDLTLSKEEYKASTDLAFTVDNFDVANIHNRWNGSYATTANETSAGFVKSNDPKEYTWASESKKDYEVPNSQIVKNDKGSNVTVDTKDARFNKSLLNAKVGVPFTVKMKNDAVKYYYVTLDENFAIESTPSELNAWKQYSYSGLNTVVKADETLDITVNDLNNVKGDIIGFRLFAVNYDGTLVDPDGKAFYVKVGDPEQANAVDVKINVKKAGAGSEIVALPEGFASCVNGLRGDFLSGTKDLDEHHLTTADGAQISYELLGKKNNDGTYASVTDWKDAKFVKVTLNDVQKFQDGQKWTVVAQASKGSTLGDVVNVLTINVEKVMPTTTPDKITWKTAQTKDGVYYCYVEPSEGAAKAINATWNTASDYGYKNLAKAVNGLSDGNYVFEIANAQLKDKKYTETLPVYGTDKDTYNMQADAALVDNTTKHAISVSYDYKNISYAPNKDGKLEAVEDYPVQALAGDVVFTCAVDKPVQTYAWAQIPAEYKEGKLVAAAKDVNAIVYEKTDPENTTAAALYNYIKATNTWDPDFGGIHKFNELYTKIKDVKLVTAEGANAGLEEYYDVDLDYATSAFTFTLKSGTTNPNADVKSTLIIVTTDAFGHENTIELPFVVKQKK